MPKHHSAKYNESVNSTAPKEVAVLLLEIRHESLPIPIRVVQDKKDIVHLGDTYTALNFRATPPDEPEQGQGTAKLALDNVGQIEDGQFDRSIGEWLEESNGAEGTTVRMIQVLRSEPDNAEWDIVMDLSDISLTTPEVTGVLGFDDLLNQPGVAIDYRPNIAPGLF